MSVSKLTVGGERVMCDREPVTLKGIVVKWQMMNPHGWITMDVTGPDGEKIQADKRFKGGRFKGGRFKGGRPVYRRPVLSHKCLLD